MASRLAGVFAVLVLAGSLSAQQFHGVGASLTSSSPAVGPVGARPVFGSRSGFQTRGIPPSLTSITPGQGSRTRNFSQGGGFTPGDFGRRGGFHGRGGHHGRGRGNNFVPFYVPTYSYPYYPYGYSDDYANGDYANGMDQPQPEPDDQRPALTIFENRPGYRPPPVSTGDSRDYPSDTATDRDRDAASRRDVPAPEPPPVADQAPTVLIFADGHRLEIGNYAIQGDLLYNLDGKGPRKIKLTDLDLDKTVQANDERGNEFRLPKKYRG
jgi:hypothetical protein